MKKLILILLFSQILYSQSASKFLPVVKGNSWHYTNIVLDTLGNPVPGSQYNSIDSLVLYENFAGKLSAYITTQVGGVVTDTGYFSLNGGEVLTYSNAFDIPDSLISLTIPEWFPYVKYNINNNATWEIFRFDTTVNLNGVNTPLRIIGEGRKIGNTTVTVPAGTFNVVHSTLSLRVGTVIIIFIPIVTIPLNIYTAQDSWVIKTESPPVTNATLGLVLPGTRKELTAFYPWSNRLPQIISTPDTIAFVDSFYSYQVVTFDPDTNIGDVVSLSLTQGAFNLILSENGILSGTPTISDIGTHKIIIKATDTFGGESEQEFNINVTDATSINEEFYPNDFVLFQNFPNPFNPSTEIGYQISENRNVKLTVYDILGNEIAVLVNELKSPGNHSVDFNADGLSSGIYYYRLTAGEFTDTKKMIYLK